MSNPTMNHSNSLQEVTDQQQQQQATPALPSLQDQVQFSQVPSSTTSSLDTPTTMTLTRSDSASTVILEEEEKRVPPRRKDPRSLPPSVLANLNLSLRSLLKTSGLFNESKKSLDIRRISSSFPIESGSFDKLNDLFASGNEFTLQRLLSDVGNELPLDINDLLKFDSVKMLDSRTLSDFVSRSVHHVIAFPSLVSYSRSDRNPSINC